MTRLVIVLMLCIASVLCNDENKLLENTTCVNSKLVVEQKPDVVHLKIVSDSGESILDVNNKNTQINDMQPLIKKATEILFPPENKNRQDNILNYYVTKRLINDALEVIVQCDEYMTNITLFRKSITGETLGLPENVKCAHINGLDVIIDPNWDIKQRDGYNMTSLTWACLFGKTDLARSLVDRGTDVNQRAEKDMNPLIGATISNQYSLVKLLIEKGAKVDQGLTILSPLHTAAFSGRTKIATLLIEHGAPVDVAIRKEGLTPLLLAVIGGHETMVTLLIRNRAEVNSKTNGEWTALHFAVTFQHPSIVHQLLEAGARINAQDTNGDTPLMNAIKRGNDEPGILPVVEQLLNQQDLNVNLKNSKGDTALTIAHKKGFTKVEELLKSKGAV